MRHMTDRMVAQAALAAIAIICAVLLSLPVLGEEETNELDVRLAFDQFPDEYTCEGNDTSPEIVIEGVNATSIAMIMDDPDAPVGTFSHWVIWNISPIDLIPGDFPRDASVEEPFFALQGNNSAGEIGYLGPCPPPGKPHRYYFRIYGLDVVLDLEPGASRQELEEAMQGHVLQKGEAMATYER